MPWWKERVEVDGGGLRAVRLKSSALSNGAGGASVGHPRPHDHHHGSSGKRFSSKSDLTTKHAGGMHNTPVWEHPRGHMRASRRNIKARALAFRSDHLSIRGPRGCGHVVMSSGMWQACCGRGAVPRVTGLPLGDAVARSASDAAGDVPNRCKRRRVGLKRVVWRGRPHCRTAAVRVWRTYRA